VPQVPLNPAYVTGRRADAERLDLPEVRPEVTGVRSRLTELQPEVTQFRRELGAPSEGRVRGSIARVACGRGTLVWRSAPNPETSKNVRPAWAGSGGAVAPQKERALFASCRTELSVVLWSLGERGGGKENRRGGGYGGHASCRSGFSDRSG
jgi:hypothetical protein